MTNARVDYPPLLPRCRRLRAAFVGLAGAASANPATVVSVKAGIQVDAGVALRVGTTRSTRDHRGEIIRTPVVRRDNRFIPWTEVVRRRAMNRYDINHNRRIDAAERRAFWTLRGRRRRVRQAEQGRGAAVRAARVPVRRQPRRPPRRRRVARHGQAHRLAAPVQEPSTATATSTSPRTRLVSRPWLPASASWTSTTTACVSQQEVRDDVLKMYRNGEC